MGKSVVAARNKDSKRQALGPGPANAQGVNIPSLKEKDELKVLRGEYPAIVDTPQVFSFSPERCLVICKDGPAAIDQDHAGKGIVVLTGELGQDEASVCRQTCDWPAVDDAPAARRGDPALDVRTTFTGPWRCEFQRAMNSRISLRLSGR